GWTFALVPPGEFLQGSDDDENSLARAGLQLPAGHHISDERPPKTVQLTKPWYLQTTFVTVARFSEFVSATDYRTDCERNGTGGYGCDSASGCSEQQPRFSWRDPGFVQQPDHPAVNVTWHDCIRFIDWLSSRFPDRPRQGRFRLPSESEFEYCLRAGSRARFPTGQLPPPQLSSGQSVAAGVSVTELLTGRRLPAWFLSPRPLPWPNAFELTGLPGTVWHWCADQFSPQSAGDQRRTQRGGSWALPATQLRCSLRRGRPPEFCCHRSGFRIAVELF
ncbi:MAG: formylglycine-generating enzyme family protein, partial [Planctomycetaceae bacterium]